MFTREDSEYWLKKTQEIARIGSWGQDPRTGELWWSDQTYLLFDLDPQGSKMTIDRFMSFIHPDDLELVQQVTALALKSDHSPYKVGFRITLPKQAERYIYQEAQVERDNCGEAVRVVGIIQDVTERKHDEKLLRDSEQKFRLLASNAHDWEYWLNPQGEYVYVSPACEKITGYTPEEFIATPELLCDIVHPAYVERVCPHFRQENNSGTPAGSREFAITTKGGEERWIIHYCRPIFDAEGQYLGRCGNNRDITEQKQAEIDLQESHNQLDSIFRASPVGIGIVVNRIIKFLNSSAIETIGYSEAELYGKNTRIIFASDAEFERVGKEQSLQIEETGTSSVETVIRKKNGDLIDVMINLTPIELQDPSQGFTFIVSDITARKQSEIDLQENHNQLDSIFRASPVGIGVVVNRQFKFLNGRALEMLGYSEAELYGINTRIIYASDAEFERVGREHVAQIEATGTCSVETVFQSKNGKLLDVMINLTPLDFQDLSQGLTFIILDITIRKQAEAALHESHKQLNSIFRAVPAGIGVVVDRKIKFVNDRFVEMMGYSEAELIGSNSRLVYHSDAEFEWVGKEKYAQIKENGTGTVETIFQKKDGTLINVLLSSTPLDLQDLSKGVTFTALNITIRKQFEKALQESEARFKALHDASFGGVIIHEHGLILDCNQALSEITGFSNKELVGMDGLDLIAPDCLEIVLQNIKSGFAQGYEVEGVRKDGSIYPLAIRGKNIFYQGRDVRVIEFRDITARKQVEVALAAREKQLRQIIDLVPYNIFVKDETGKFEIVNKALADTFGTTVENLTGRKDVEFVANAGEMAHFRADDLEVIRLGKTKFIAEEQITNSVNEVRFLQTTKVPFEISGDGKNALLGIAVDITERKINEEERRNLENQLHQKNKIEAVGLMAGGMAHNFNNNLAIILGNLELSKMKLANNSPISEIGDFINNAKIAVLRSRDLVQQIQTYSRNKQNEKAPILLPQIIDETVKLLRSTIPSTIDLQQTGNDNITINGDPSQLQEVLINLCNNAIHAMAEKGTLTISLEVDELRQEDIPIQYSCTAGNYAKISVQDTGTGMPVEIQEKIFDPFFTTKEVGVGTGMGLSTVQGIVSQHNGMIKVISAVGAGTTFDLYLPIIERRMKERSQNITAVPTGTEKILFLDDEEMLGNVWSEMLRQYGYQVTTMTDSVKALELFKEDPAQFDLIISDQTMPVLCGKEFLREVVNIRPSLPTIICTGFTTQITEEEAKQMGITEYCLKPLELPPLLQTIRRVLDDGKG